nr:hypothetical protein [uncultured Ottowia sp.]
MNICAGIGRVDLQDFGRIRSPVFTGFHAGRRAICLVEMKKPDKKNPANFPHENWQGDSGIFTNSD